MHGWDMAGWPDAHLTDKGAGMTDKGAGMTDKGAGITDKGGPEGGQRWSKGWTMGRYRGGEYPGVVGSHTVICHAAAVVDLFPDFVP